MNSADKTDKDFIDKFLEIFEPYQKAGIRSVAVVICFALCFFLGIFFAPSIIKSCKSVLPFAVNFIQISPLEVLYNYIKVGFFFALFLVFPFFVYQFGKLKIDQEDPEDRANLILTALILFIIVIISGFLTYKFIFPLGIIFLYGLNFDVAEFASSLSAIVSTFIFALFVVSMAILLPFLRFLIKKSILLDYATLTKSKRKVIIGLSILAAIIALPLEIVALALVFLTFFIFYKILISFAKKRD